MHNLTLSPDLKLLARFGRLFQPSANCHFGQSPRSNPIEGSDKRRCYAVLHLGGIRSPLDAVRAAIVAERRQ